MSLGRHHGVAIVGPGGAANAHVRILRRIKGVQVAGVVGSSVDKAHVFAARHGIRAYESFEDALADPQVDVVAIFTPHHLHAPLGSRAVRAGKHVLMEKPIGTELKSVDELIRDGRERGRVIGVVSQLRFEPGPQLVRRILERKGMGGLVISRGEMVWCREERYYTDRPWRMIPEQSGGGVLITQGIHLVDLMLWIHGPVRAVSGRVDNVKFRGHPVEDTCVAILEFAGGGFGVIEASVAGARNNPITLSIQGVEGTIVLSGNRLRRCEGACRVGWKERWWLTRRNWLKRVRRINSFRTQFTDFFQAVEEGRDPLVSAAQARRALAVVRAVYDSARTRKTVDLEPQAGPMRDG